jgi:excisionase family DNA binding protein
MSILKKRGLTVYQAAEVIGVCHSQVLNLIHDGTLRYQMHGPQYDINPADVAKYKRNPRPRGRPKAL